MSGLVGGGGGGAKARLWGGVARGHIGVIAAVLLAIVLTWPSIHAGLFTDDYYQRWILTRTNAYADVRPPRMEMFTFFDGNPARTQRMKQLGLMPWWMHDGVRARFWRPVTTITHLADYQFWPRHVPWMHGQSIAWYAALALVVGILYRQTMGRTVAAALGAVMFAIDDAHAIPVGFIASRNALIAAVFGVLAIMCHRRWRLDEQSGRRRRLRFAILAVDLFIVSLLSAEAGLATFGYLIAYELVLDRGRWTRRAAALLPYVIAIVVWRALWRWYGYGVSGVDDLYADPLAQPLTFIGDVLVRLPILLLAQAGYPPAEIALLTSGVGLILCALIGVAGVSWCVWMLWDLLRHNRTARFWLVGVVLSAIPLCAPAPSNRMLLFIGIGAFGLTGEFLSMALHARFWRGLSRSRRLGRFSFVAATVIMHFVAAPVVLMWQSGAPMGWPQMWEAMQDLPNVTEHDTGRDLIVVNHPLALNMSETLLARAYDGLPIPRSTTILAPSGAALVLTRVDERTLELRVDAGYFPDTFSRLFYTAEHPAATNVPMDLPAVRVTVLALTADSGPRVVKFQFNAPLEDASSLRWLYWRNGSFQRFTPPAVGKSVELPRGRFPF